MFLEETKKVVHLRWMIRRDMAEVLSIEQNSFYQPWQEDDFLNCLRQRNCIGMVAELGEKVVGYWLYELNDGYVTILKIAVDPNYRRQKIGSQMVDKMICKLSSHRRTKIVVDVSEMNLTAHLFFKSLNFKAVAVSKNFFDYEDKTDDAYHFVYSLPEVEENLEEQTELINRLISKENY